MRAERRSIAEIREPVEIDVLVHRPSRAKRDRSWEKRVRREQGQVCYRGVPAEVNEAIKAIAQELGVVVGEVARAFLEEGIRQYRAGRLRLTVHKVGGRWTIYPPERGKNG